MLANRALCCLRGAFLSILVFASALEAATSPSLQSFEPNPESRLPAKDTARVRIPVKITAYKAEAAKTPDGKNSSSILAQQPLEQILRARLDQPNHFYVGDWHIETKPRSWSRQSRRYQVQLELYRRYGQYGELEESVGTVDVAGVLVAQESRLFALHGVSKKRLRDKNGIPIVEISAGYELNAQQTKGVAKENGSPEQAVKR